MLETLWYMLVLIVQILQANPQLKTDRMQMEVYVASKPAYSFIIQGNAVQGQFVNAETRAIFGEFESTRRIPQAYVIFPRQALSQEMESALKAGSGKGNGGSIAGATPNSPKENTAPSEMVPLTIDFTKALKQLVSFKSKPRQTIEFTEKERLLGNDKDPSAAKLKTTPSPLIVPTTSASPAASESPSPDSEKKDMIEIRQYSNRLVLSADFAQLLIIVNFM